MKLLAHGGGIWGERVVSKQVGVQQLERAGVDKLVQREVLTGSPQVRTNATFRLVVNFESLVDLSLGYSKLVLLG